MSSKLLNTQLLMEVGNEMLSMVSRKYHDIEKLSFPVLPKVQPGFLRQQLPSIPPLQAEDLRDILKDTEERIFPGLTLWSHPNFFGYYPSNITHASIIAEIFASSFSSPGFQWITSPAQTELENIVCDWMVHAMQLPEKFYLRNSGGGTISNTVSDAVFTSIHAAKRRKMKELGIDLMDPRILKFSAYYAENAHSCAAKGLLIKDIHNSRALPVKFCVSTQNYQIDLNEFQRILSSDIKNGLIPFWTSGNWGTTGTCSYDQIEEIGKLCQQHQMWFNVDAAYAGSSWIIPKYRQRVIGLENADSIQINFGKLMQVGSGTLFYVGDKSQLIESMGQKIEFSLFKNSFTESQDVMDYKDWQVGLGRRFNSLKIWWMIRSLGVYGMQEQIEEKIQLAQYLESLIKQNPNFKLFTKSELTLVTFVYSHQDLRKQNELNRLLQQNINSDTHLGYITGSEIKGTFFLRVAVANNSTTKESIDLFWNRVVKLSETLI